MDSARAQPGRGADAGRQTVRRIDIDVLLNPVRDSAAVERSSASTPTSVYPTGFPSVSFPHHLADAIPASRPNRPPVLIHSCSTSSAYNDVGTPTSPQSELVSISPETSHKHDARTVRPPRPSYSEEQKFFIMYARIMQDHTWPQIEDQFSSLWERRSKGGLTSVYYRVRRDWGMMEVLKGGPDSFAGDCSEVENRAKNFSTTFLRQIGYPL